MRWIKVSDVDLLSNGDLIGIDYNNKRILIAKVRGGMVRL